jgi:dUTP pyrophosphatase
MSNSVVFRKLNEDAIVPTIQTSLSSGYDLFANEDVVIWPGEFKLVGTGIQVDMQGMEAQVRSRSGLAAKHGIAVLNSPGTVDEDYKGEIKVILINHGKKDFKVNKGDRIAQLVFAFVQRPVNSIVNKERGTGGFGSTGGGLT